MSVDPRTAELIKSHALEAVANAKRLWGVDLNFSSESVEDVERILGSVFGAPPAGFLSKLFSKGPSERTFAIYADMYGCYIGEVMRAATNAEWFHDEKLGPGICKGDTKLWPIMKTQKRLANGDGDNVWVYFQVAIKEYLLDG